MSVEELRHRIDSLSKGEGTIRIVKRGVGIVQNGGDLLGQRIEQTGRGEEEYREEMQRNSLEV